MDVDSYRRLTDRGSAAAAPRGSEYQSGGRRASTTRPAAAGHATWHCNQSGAAVSCNRSLGGEHPDWDDYRRAMVNDRRAVVRLKPTRAYGMLNLG